MKHLTIREYFLLNTCRITYQFIFNYRHANLPCVVIHGYLKGSTYNIGLSVEKNKDTLYGEWNAVLVDNVWRFVNAFWGACAVGSDPSHRDTTYGVDETFFLPEPEQLAYSHFPAESKWQLMDKPVSMKEFEKRAFLKERFFELEMRILSHRQNEIATENGEVEFTFGIPTGKMNELKFMCLLFVQENNEWNLLSENKQQYDMIYFPNENSQCEM